jgi:cytochrome c556
MSPVAGSPCAPYGKLLRFLEKVYSHRVMENQTPIKTRKPRTVKEAAPHVANLKKAVSKALKAEHAYSLASAKAGKQIERIKASLKTKRGAVKAAWYEVQHQAGSCIGVYDGAEA